MNRKKPNTKVIAVAAAAFVLVAALLHNAVRAQTVPGLSIALTGTNQVTLVVTNGSPTNVYQIWWTEFLDANALVLTNGAWTVVAAGTTGQTNFVLTYVTDTGFFRAINGSDFDNDGFPDWEDARPFDPNVGILTVTIETPANGSNVQ